MNKYKDTISFWDNIFIKQEPKNQLESIKMHNDIEDGICWLSKESKSILDYGCGSGDMLLKCACYENICKCLGIDISKEAVELAKETAILNNLENKSEFCCGEIMDLERIQENSFDGAILSNIIDNIMIDDAVSIMNNISRIVIPNGKILIKLNPYLEQEQLENYGLELLEDNLYVEKEGIYIRNLSTVQWEEFIKEFFDIIEYKDIYFEKYNQYNRMFLLSNNNKYSK